MTPRVQLVQVGLAAWTYELLCLRQEACDRKEKGEENTLVREIRRGPLNPIKRSLSHVDGEVVQSVRRSSPARSWSQDRSE